MSKTVFVDTSAWFAGIAKNDQYNEQAIKYRDQLLRGSARFITSNLVIHETTMLLERKVSKKEAIHVNPASFAKALRRPGYARRLALHNASKKALAMDPANCQWQFVGDA